MIVIIAAGEGSRLREAGWAVPKPMVLVAGVPLIESAIRNFVAAGITRLSIIVNEQERDCAAWVRRGWYQSGRPPGLRAARARPARV